MVLFTMFYIFIYSSSSCTRSVDCIGPKPAIKQTASSEKLRRCHVIVFISANKMKTILEIEY